MIKKTNIELLRITKELRKHIVTEIDNRNIKEAINDGVLLSAAVNRIMEAIEELRKTIPNIKHEDYYL